VGGGEESGGAEVQGQDCEWRKAVNSEGLGRGGTERERAQEWRARKRSGALAKGVVRSQKEWCARSARAASLFTALAPPRWHLAPGVAREGS